MNSGAKCGCNHSLAVICGLFAGMAVVLVLAEDRCRDSGGRVSDAAWSCESGSGVVRSLWDFGTPGMLAVALCAGLAVYAVVSVAGRRWLFRYGKRRDRQC